MRVVHTTHSLDGSTGVQSYLLTVADEMQRTGHEVWLYSTELGSAAEYAETLGLRVIRGVDELPDEIDFAVAHSSVGSHEFDAACPGVPQVSVAHGSYFDVYTPPQIDGAVACVVTLWPQAAKRMAALATSIPVVTLSQPVDRARFRDRAPIPERPRKALILSNYLDGERRERIEKACELAGLELEHVGATGSGQSNRAEDAINRADIVIGKGRAAVEGMACGRAVYVYDMWGSDGWITPDTYEGFAYAGFSGVSTDRDLSADEIANEFRDYSQSLGEWGVKTAATRHRLTDHAARLIELGAEAAGDGSRERGKRGEGLELARLARLSWRHEGQAHVHSEHLKQQSQRIDALERDLDASRIEVQELVAELDTMRGSKSWKLTAPLRRIRSKDD